MFQPVKEYRDLRKKFNYKMFQSGVPVFREFEELEAKTFAAGALEPKYKELIGLAASIVSLCYGCIEHHTSRALECGAPRQLVLETTAIAVMLGGGPAQWPARYVFQVLDELEEKAG